MHGGGVESTVSHRTGGPQAIHAQRAGIRRHLPLTARATAVPTTPGRDDASGASWLNSQASNLLSRNRDVIVRYRDQAQDTQGDDQPTGSKAAAPVDDSFTSSSRQSASVDLRAGAEAHQGRGQLSTPDKTPVDSTAHPTQSMQDAFSELFPVASSDVDAYAASSAGPDVDDEASTETTSSVRTPHGTHASSGVAWQHDESTAGLKPKQSSVDKVKAKLDDLSSRYKALDSRLDSLESTLVNLLQAIKQKASNPAAAAGVGSGTGAAEVPGVGSVVELPEFEYDPDDEDKDAGMFDLKKLQTSLTENINRGYLESVKHLRELLMAYEWHLHGKELAERKGVAQFEKYCAENDLQIDFEAVSKLYQDPNDLSHLPDNKTRLLARSIIQNAVDERYCSIYFQCTNTAKELAHTGLKDLIPDSAGKVGGVIKDVLPLPGFLKK